MLDDRGVSVFAAQGSGCSTPALQETGPAQSLKYTRFCPLCGKNKDYGGGGFGWTLRRVNGVRSRVCSDCKL